MRLSVSDTPVAVRIGRLSDIETLKNQQLGKLTERGALLGAFVGAASFGNAASLKQIRDEYLPIAIGSLLAIALYVLTNASR
ncbi:hypothetical protein AWB76_05053 [Caballeronia temeraria]|uniref:Uncharacterized protein n=1 Tax=Caballeronia temeraria TaxID=1777137 RepID=A0A158C3F1_9BURK|nr:hypothetical protein [Caballeronia temeraria]SAK76781.1 hypothetical protein AWB76_05053 [Caballeronia temeraria]